MARGALHISYTYNVPGLVYGSGYDTLPGVAMPTRSEVIPYLAKIIEKKRNIQNVAIMGLIHFPDDNIGETFEEFAASLTASQGKSR